MRQTKFVKHKMASSTQIEKKFLNRVVIITGGSSGIGAGCVKHFYDHGANVVFCSNAETDGKALEKQLRECKQGNQIDFVFADVTKENEVKNVVDFCINKHKRIDCLVNNVGWHPLHLTIDHFSTEDFRKLLEVNVVSHFMFDKFCLPHLRKCPHPDGASIINMSSISNLIGQNGSVTYVATKGAVAGMTRALAVDEGEHKIRVFSVSPGSTDTPLMWDIVRTQSTNVEKSIKEIEDQSVLHKLGTVLEVAKAVLFLAADATCCTGIDLNLSGGWDLDKRKCATK